MSSTQPLWASPAPVPHRQSVSITPSTNSLSSTSGPSICHKCNTPITGAQFIRVADVSFHRDCFNCTVCNCPLADKKPRSRDGLFYCPDDFHKLFSHTCRTCNQLITSGGLVKALGSYFHHDHFVCETCKKPFPDGRYYEYNGNAYCPEHHKSVFKVPTCTRCLLPISDVDIISLKGQPFHTKCLHCDHCKIELSSESSVVYKDGFVLCREDYIRFYSRLCTKCGQPILKQIVAVNGESYHLDCFKCTKCDCQLDSYLQEQGYLLCNDHASAILPTPACSVCSLPISQGLTAILSCGKTTHPNCFKCSSCGVGLEKSTARVFNDKLSCIPCIAKTGFSDTLGNAVLQYYREQTQQTEQQHRMQNMMVQKSQQQTSAAINTNLPISSNVSVSSFGQGVPNSGPPSAGFNGQNNNLAANQSSSFILGPPPHASSNLNLNASASSLQTPTTGPRYTTHQRQHSHFVLPSTQPTTQAPQAPSTPQFLPSSTLSPHAQSNHAFAPPHHHTNSAPNPSNPLSSAHSVNQFAPSPSYSNTTVGTGGPSSFRPTPLNLNISTNAPSQSQRVQFQIAPSTPSHHVHHSHLSQFTQSNSINENFATSTQHSSQPSRPNSAQSGINNPPLYAHSQQSQSNFNPPPGSPQLQLPTSLIINTSIANKGVPGQPSSNGSSTPLSNSSSFSSQSGFQPTNSAVSKPVPKPPLNAPSQLPPSQQPGRLNQMQPKPPSTTAPTIPQQNIHSANSTPQSATKYLPNQSHQPHQPHQQQPNPTINQSTIITPIQPPGPTNSNDSYLTDEQRRQQSKQKLQLYHATIQKEKELGSSNPIQSTPQSTQLHPSGTSNGNPIGVPPPNLTINTNPTPSSSDSKPNYLAPANREQAHQRRENVELIKRQQEQLKSGNGAPVGQYPAGNIVNSSSQPNLQNQLRPSYVQTNNGNPVNQPVSVTSPVSNAPSALSPTANSESTTAGDTFGTMSMTCPIEWRRGELIGKGSFGKVYMGMNSTNGELIAIKQVNITNADDLEAIQQLQTEIALMSTLRHPNVVGFLGTQRSGSKLNILMEYIPGKSLDVLLSTFGPFTEKVMVSYTRQLLGALAYCHDQGVVHRDIKGKNVLVDTSGNLKLADFGSAKRIISAEARDAPSLGYNYTPLWTAPEVLVGDYNSKVDIWSLGCVVIEMASGKAPWSEHNFEHPFRALYHIANTTEIPKIPDRLSPLGRDFIATCLRRDPDQRPSAKELLQHPWLKQDDKDARK